MGFDFVTNSTDFPVLIRSMRLVGFFQLMMNTDGNLSLENYWYIHLMEQEEIWLKAMQAVGSIIISFYALHFLFCLQKGFMRT